MNHKDLEVWKESMNLVEMVYSLANQLPGDEKFGLISQLKRAAVSVPSNIAEGWGRESTKNFVHFLRIARGSLYELETQLIISKELKYCKDFGKIDGFIIEIGKMLNSLIKKLGDKD